jgi:hypothetical protein
MRMGLGLSLRQRSSGAPSFNPLTLTPTAWYDPSDLTSMRQSGTRGAPGAAAAVDSPVGLLLDKSGNNYDMAQATAGLRPILRSSGGFYWLEFDGADDGLLGPMAFGGDILTAWAGVRNTTPANNQRVFSMTDPAGVDYDSAAHTIPIGVFSTGGYSAYRNGQISTVAFAADTFAVVQSKFDGANHTLRINGANNTPLASTGTFATSETRIGNGFSSGGPFAGRFYGGGILNRVLTAPEQANLDTYTAGKAGLAL